MFTLTGAVQTCSVNTGYANKLWSDRQENPNNLMCPLWNGLDQYGRSVAFDSYNTKSAGCSSALDRVAVENMQRPQYIDFIALDANGYLSPTALGAPVNPSTKYQQQTDQLRAQSNRENYERGGSVGIQFSKTNAPHTNGVCPANGGITCGNGMSGYRPQLRENYVDTRANRNFQDRRDLSNISSWKSNCNACAAGNR